MRNFCTLILLAFAGHAAAQTATPDTKQVTSPDAPPKPRPVLKLRLDDAAPPPPTVTFGKPEEKKKDDTASTLPGLGGPRTREWEPASSTVFPRDSGPDSKLPN